VYLVLVVRQTSSGGYIATSAGYGDEGKFVWMARISGTYESTYIKDGYMGTKNGFYQWKDESEFGQTDNQTGIWSWNTNGDNSTINEIMYSTAQQYASLWSQQGTSISTAWAVTSSGTTVPWQASTPTYFTPVQIFGENVSPLAYGGIIPLVALYKVNYGIYYADTGTIGTGVTKVS